MKVLTIKQPWATLIVEGYKEYEFRTWNTKYRGELLIHICKWKIRILELWGRCMDNALRPALMKVGEDTSVIPVRGIAKFENNGYTYTFKQNGTIEKFDGIEQIYKDNKLIYELHCSGGVIE